MSRNSQKLLCTETRIAQPLKQVHRWSMLCMKDNRQGYLFCIMVFIYWGSWWSTRGHWSWAKNHRFSNTRTLFSFLAKLTFFERFLYHSTKPIEFYLILTYIWSISLFQIAQLKECEIRSTSWTLSYRLEVTKSLIYQI